jgi:putative membrane protein
MHLASVLPTVNAVLNGTSGALLTAGFVAIRSGKIALHRALMLTACGTSTLFLASYLTRVALTGTHRYPGGGAAKFLYLAVLASHTLLAMAVLPLALRTLQLSLLAQRFDAHKRIARITLPVWLYVSVTGVIVYVMLYHFA